MSELSHRKLCFRSWRLRVWVRRWSGFASFQKANRSLDFFVSFCVKTKRKEKIFVSRVSLRIDFHSNLIKLGLLPISRSSPTGGAGKTKSKLKLKAKYSALNHYFEQRMPM